MPFQNGFITDVEAGRIDASQNTGPRASAGPRPGVIRFNFKHLAAHWQGHGHDEAPRLELGIIMGQAKVRFHGGHWHGSWAEGHCKGSLASTRAGTTLAWKKRWTRCKKAADAWMPIADMADLSGSKFLCCIRKSFG
jgi:hypothetical protein